MFVSNQAAWNKMSRALDLLNFSIHREYVEGYELFVHYIYVCGNVLLSLIVNAIINASRYTDGDKSPKTKKKL